MKVLNSTDLKEERKKQQEQELKANLISEELITALSQAITDQATTIASQSDKIKELETKISNLNK